MFERLIEFIGWIMSHVQTKSLVSDEFLYRTFIQIFSGLLRYAGEFLVMVMGFVGILSRFPRRNTIDRLHTPSRQKGRLLKKTLRVAGGITTLAGIAKIIAERKAGEEEEVSLPKRQLGSMDFNASILGMGGTHIPDGTVADSLALLETAFELGINYFDTATQYGSGESERRYGLWLETLEAEGRRGEVFVATKTLSRGYSQAAEEIEDSFSRLRTEYIDLLQVHAVNDLDTWRQVTSRNGSLRAIEQAKESRRVRHIGITGHKDPAMILQAIGEYPFDSVLMPLGITDHYNVPFVAGALPGCVAKGLSIVAMKVFSEGRLVESGADLQRCLHYTLSLPISTAIIGMASVEQVIQNVAWVKSFIGMTPEEIEALEAEVKELIDTNVEWWKQ